MSNLYPPGLGATPSVADPTGIPAAAAAAKPDVMNAGFTAPVMIALAPEVTACCMASFIPDGVPSPSYRVTDQPSRLATASTPRAASSHPASASEHGTTASLMPLGTFTALVGP